MVYQGSLWRDNDIIGGHNADILSLRVSCDDEGDVKERYAQ